MLKEKAESKEIKSEEQVRTKVSMALEFDKDAQYLIQRLDEIEKEDALMEYLMDIRSIAKANIVTNSLKFQRM